MVFADCGSGKGRRKGIDNVLTSQGLTKQSAEKSIKCPQLKRHWEALQKDRFSPNLMLTRGFTR